MHENDGRSHEYNFQLHTSVLSEERSLKEIFFRDRPCVTSIAPNQTEERKRCCQDAKPTTFGTYKIK